MNTHDNKQKKNIQNWIDVIWIDPKKLNMKHVIVRDRKGREIGREFLRE